MRSTAHFQGHPIHPALIPYPFAFLSGAFLFNLAGWYFDRPPLWIAGGYVALAGMATALIAAVPGFVDYLYTVPPNSSGKSRAAKHGLLNIGSLLLFAGAWWVRGGSGEPPTLLTLGMELIGFAMLNTAGYMGGTLVSRNQISIDHRYAGAGKWKDETIHKRPGEPLIVARTDELEPNQMKLVRVNGKRIVVARTEKGYVAFDDRCTHKGGSLAGGSLACATVQCPWHGSQFDVDNGEVKYGPAKKPIKTYRTEEEKGEVRLVL
ncbi:MAG TPA: Rieske 2Fe-2S domain-containing protein [Acidobacteriota bacterium]